VGEGRQKYSKKDKKFNKNKEILVLERGELG